MGVFSTPIGLMSLSPMENPWKFRTWHFSVEVQFGIDPISYGFPVWFGSPRFPRTNCRKVGETVHNPWDLSGLKE